MKTVCIVVLVTLIATFSNISAEPGDTVWTRTYGGEDEDMARSIISAHDNNLMVAGWSYSYPGQYHNAYYYILKTDTDGNMLWEKFYWGDRCHNWGYAIQKTNDECYVFVGRGYASLVKFDSTGIIKWYKDYEGTFYAIDQTLDNGYTLVGIYDSGAAAYCLRTDAFGDSMWSIRNYGGSGGSIRFYSVIQLDDGDIAATGLAIYYDEYSGWHNEQMYFERIDALGGVQWTETYGDFYYDNRNDICYSAIQLDDRGFILAGAKNYNTEGGYDFNLIKTDEDGNLLWNKTYGTNDSEIANSVTMTIDGGFFAVGFVKDSNNVKDIYLVRTDSEGDELWSRRYGGPQNDEAYSVVSTDGGELFVVGYTESFGMGDKDIWLLKIEDITTSVQEEVSIIPSITGILSIYPNPFNSKTRIEYHLPENGNAVIEIYNIIGQKITTISINGNTQNYNTVSWNADSYSSGNYFIRLTQGKHVFHKRALLIK